MANLPMFITMDDELIEELLEALNDAINSPKGVIPLSAEPFYDGRKGRVKTRKEVKQCKQQTLL